MLGSFPPSPKRWSMDFFYPNFTNDMWRIFGWCFYGDKNHFVDLSRKTFRQDLLIPFLELKGIGLYDTARVVRRLKNTASDKDLEVVEAVDLSSLMSMAPYCQAVATTGQKATDILCAQFGIEHQPALGSAVEFAFEGRTMQLFRMPSSSRAYPLPIERKAAVYRQMFEHLQLLP
ncbi:MAG: uracil-DNA glycosylase family protein [Prevotella sp.]|nr:uracil-DNA glycosylase family protein [Prevotella sp.]